MCENAAAEYGPQLHKCALTAARTMFARQWHKRFEKVEPDMDGWLPTDGVMVWASADLEPDDDFRPDAIGEMPTFGSAATAEDALAE